MQNTCGVISLPTLKLFMFKRVAN